jgi:hypothetical protein
MKWALRLALLCGLCLACEAEAPSEDLWYPPPVAKPSYPYDGGPLILIDAGHHNTHTLERRYPALAQVARRDGYRVQGSSAPFSRGSLARAQILVVANALHERNRVRTGAEPGDWSLPTPAAFSPEEIGAVRDWVREGGALLLAADHMPFAGAAAELAAAFGVRFDNAFTIDEEVERAVGDPAKAVSHVTVFRRADGGLAGHAITDGRNEAERVNAVAAFGGHAFRADGNAAPLLVLGPTAVSLFPDVAWEFPPETPRRSAAGWLQGAALRFGRGRVAVFAEAGLFGVQTSGAGEPVGMNAPEAAQNPRFLMNLLHWLSGLLDADATADAEAAR